MYIQFYITLLSLLTLCSFYYFRFIAYCTGLQRIRTSSTGLGSLMPRRRRRERQDIGTFSPSHPPLSTQATPGFERTILQYVETSTDKYSSPSESTEYSMDTLHYAPETPVSPDNHFDEECIDNTMAELEPTACRQCCNS